MQFDQALIDNVLKNADIVKIISSFVPLVKKGKNFLAKCPFHDDKNPSLTVSPEKKIFKCFVCGTSGTAITFVQKYLKISFSEALVKVAEMSGFEDPRLKHESTHVNVDPKKNNMINCLKDLTLFYEYALKTEEGKAGLEYFKDRNINDEQLSKYHLGYSFDDGEKSINVLKAKGHSIKTIDDTGIATQINGTYIDKNHGRVIFPIFDLDSNVIGFSARRINNDDSVAKYVNSQETYLFHKSNVLYNIQIAKDKAKLAGKLYVVEGFMDVFALSKIGIDNVVALMGTALTIEHIKIFRMLNVEIVLCLDGDKPGQDATLKASKMLDEAAIKYSIVDNQNVKFDADEILNLKGPESLKQYISTTLSRIEFALNYYKDTNPLTTSEQKHKFIQNFIPILLNLKSRLDFDSYIRKLSAITGYEADSIKDLVSKAKENKSNENIATIINNFHPERKALRKLEMAERGLLFQMLSNKDAVDFYENKVGGFYDEIYRQIANSIIEVACNNTNFDGLSIMSFLEASDLPNKNELIKEITDLYFGSNYPKECTKELLDNLLGSINSEKERIFEKDVLEHSMDGKDPLEQARLLAEFNKKRKREIDNRRVSYAKNKEK